jgi:hypothetical protein
MKLNVSSNGNRSVSNIISITMHSPIGTSHQVYPHEVYKLVTNALNQIVNYWMGEVQLGESCYEKKIFEAI